MSNKFKVALLIGVLVVMGGSICSASVSTASAQSNYTIKVAKTTEGTLPLLMEQTMLVHPLTQHIP